MGMSKAMRQMPGACLFDRAPPLSYQTQTFQAGYDPRYTDPTGRTYYLRGSYKF
jgi:iron complex outermembrane receptor protein